MAVRNFIKITEVSCQCFGCIFLLPTAVKSRVSKCCEFCPKLATFEGYITGIAVRPGIRFWSWFGPPWLSGSFANFASKSPHWGKSHYWQPCTPSKNVNTRNFDQNIDSQPRWSGWSWGQPWRMKLSWKSDSRQFQGHGDVFRFLEQWFSQLQKPQDGVSVYARIFVH